MPSSKILVAVSSPWASEKLVETVRDLATRLRASVVVAHVCQASDEDDSQDDTRKRGEQTLKTLTDKLEAASIKCEGVLLFGDDIARAVANAAKAQRCTLMVIGLSAKGRMARWFAGDVPTSLLRNAEIPVLVYPPDWSGTI